MGNLSLLYFKDYSRFVLHLNDWRYPLMRRLPVTFDSTQGNFRIFEFPALNGFTYRLKIIGGETSALTNFQTVLESYSNFSNKASPGILRKLEVSPDDKLVRHQKEKEGGPTDMIKEVIKQSFTKLKQTTGSFKSGKKNLTSRKKKLNLKDLKNRNFRKTAKTTFKKDFFNSGEKLTKEFMEKRRTNLNLRETRELKDLLKTTDSNAPAIFLYKVEIEESILNNKDLITQGNYKLSEEQLSHEKKGIMETIKQGIHDIKESVTGMISHTHERTQERGRDTTTKTTLEKPMEPKTGLESMHYQG